jgi:hypothetical protein
MIVTVLVGSSNLPKAVEMVFGKCLHLDNPTVEKHSNEIVPTLTDQKGRNLMRSWTPQKKENDAASFAQ